VMAFNFNVVLSDVKVLLFTITVVIWSLISRSYHQRN